MKIVFFSLVLALGAMTAAAAEHTWTGRIGDSTCGAIHQRGAEDGGRAMSDHDCTLACVKNGGKFVFVRSGKVYKIENQDFAGLAAHAGRVVQLKGDLKVDTITVRSLNSPAKKKAGQVELETGKTEINTYMLGALLKSSDHHFCFTNTTEEELRKVVLGAPFIGPDGYWAHSTGKVSDYKKHVTYRNKPSEGRLDETTSEDEVTTDSERCIENFEPEHKNPLLPRFNVCQSIYWCKSAVDAGHGSESYIIANFGTPTDVGLQGLEAPKGNEVWELTTEKGKACLRELVNMEGSGAFSTGVPARIFADKHRELLQLAMVQIRERLRDLKGQKSTVISTGKEKYKEANWNPGGCVSKPRAVEPAAPGEPATPKVTADGREKP
jgi:hypothetical protein